MKMNFNVELPLGKMLFVNWEVDDRADLAWTCVVLGLVCFVYEGVKTLKSILHARRPPTSASWCSNIFNRNHLLASLLHFIQCIVSYALMLAAMTYNTWVLVSLGAGFAAGYLFFAWFSPTTSSSKAVVPLLAENEHDPCCN